MKYWTKTKLKPRRQTPNSILDGLLSQSPTPHKFADCNTLLSLELFPYPDCSSLWQVSHGSGISKYLGVSKASQVSLHSFMK